MKGTYQRRLNKTFSILALSFIIIITIFSGLFNYTYINQSNNKNLQNTVISKDSTLKNSLSLILSSTSVINATGMAREWAQNYPGNNDYYYLLQLYKEICKYGNQLNSVYYKTSITLNDQESLVVNNEGTFSKDIFFTDSYSNFTKEMWDETLEYFNTNTKPLIFPIYNNDKLKSIYYITMDFGINYKPVFIYEIPITSIIGENEDFFIYNNNGIIANSYLNDNKENFNILNKIKNSEQNNMDAIGSLETFSELIFIIKLGGFPFSVVTKYQKTMPSFIYILSFTLLLLAFAVLIIFLFHKISNKLYQPIKNTVSKLDATANENSDIDEFEIFHKNINTLNNMNKELESAIFEQNQLKKQKYFRDLIFGIPDKKCPLTEEQLLSNYCVANIELSISFEDYEGKDWFLQLQKNNIYLYIQSQNLYRECYTINTSSKSIVIIFQCDNKAEIQALLTPIFKEIDKSCSIYISASKIRKNISQISKSYKEAQYLADYKYTISENTIITNELLKRNKKDSFFFPLSMENKFIFSIVSKQKNTIDIYDELIEENLINKNLSPDTRRNFIYSLIGTMIRIFQELKVTPKELLGRNLDYPYLYSNWADKKTIDIIRNNFIDIIEAISLSNQDSNEEDKLIKNMKNYIYSNYNEDIMLIDIAQYCNISTAYCSTLFKKLSNTNFKDFLNKYRIEKACELINQNPNIKTKDLCKLVGFNSSNSFIRAFKKELNMPPKGYADFIKQK